MRGLDPGLRPTAVSGKIPFMYKQMTVAAGLMLGATLSASPAFGVQRNGAPVSIVASVGHSEWCRAGTVRLDLRSGRYTVQAPPTRRTCRTPTWPVAVRVGVLGDRDLTAVWTAWREAEASGLEDPACGRSAQGQRIVISNGGASILRVTRGRRTLAPPRDQGCWSEAARRLHSLLREDFDPRPAR